MELILDARKMLHCLETVEKALPHRSTIPVINNIHVNIEYNAVTFSATNLEMFISAVMEHEGEETGKLLLPSKIIDILRYFPTDQINIKINWENFRIDITGGSANFHIFGASPDDYPVFFERSEDSDEGFSIDADFLKSTFKSVVFATSTEESRPAFNGVLVEFDNSKITFTASDTYRLVIKEVEKDLWNFEQTRCLVPARAIREFLKLSAEGNEPLRFIYKSNILSLIFGNIYFATRLLQEKYPDVSGIIPLQYKTRITIERKVLEETVSRANLLAEGKNQAINFAVHEAELEIKVAGQEGSMDENLPVRKSGEDLQLLVNSRFILDILKVMNDSEVIIDFHGEGGPLIFRQPNDQTYIYLVLPIKKIS